MTWQLKGCLRCGGALFPEYDARTGISSMVCLQCGWRLCLRYNGRRVNYKPLERNGGSPHADDYPGVIDNVHRLPAEGLEGDEGNGLFDDIIKLYEGAEND